MVSHFSVLTTQGWQTVPASSIRVPDDAPPPTTMPMGDGVTDDRAAVEERQAAYRHLLMQYPMPTAVYRHLLMRYPIPMPWDDRQGDRIYAPYDPGVSWPDEGYPCQLCWAVGRWPWEPLRVCPLSVSVESTYCAKHAGILGT